MLPSSRGLGHRPFTAVTGVRLPYGTPFLYVARFLASAGIAQLVERYLAKVQVAGSNPVSRSKFGESEAVPDPIRNDASAGSPPGAFVFSDRRFCRLNLAGRRRSPRQAPEAGWQSGDAADCKSVYVGSIPALASIYADTCARMAELVDARDLKSLEGDFVPVRFRLRAPVLSAPQFPRGSDAAI